MFFIEGKASKTFPGFLSLSFCFPDCTWGAPAPSGACRPPPWQILAGTSVPTQDGRWVHGHLGKEKVCWLVPLPWPDLSGTQVRNDMLGMSPGELTHTANCVSPFARIIFHKIINKKEAGKSHIYSNVFTLI